MGKLIAFDEGKTEEKHNQLVLLWQDNYRREMATC